jgi:transcriptional regulator with XRE-family HTH domain
MDKKLFTERFSVLRETKNFSLNKIAQIIKIAPPSVQRFATGKTQPKLDNLIELADIFNVSLDYLVGRTDNPEVNK